jgi:cytochrome P450
MTLTIDPALNAEPADFNPFGPEFRSNPDAFYDQLLAATPGFITMEGLPSVYVANYSQVAAVLRDFSSFSSLKPKGIPGMERVDYFNGLPVMNYSDPPDHTRLRKVVNAAFTPKQTAFLVTQASRIIDDAFDKAVAQGGRLDAVGELTKVMSMQIMLDHFLRVEKADQRIFLEYFGTFPLLDKMRPGDPKPQPFLDIWEEGSAYCRRQHALAREGKCDNLIGAIASSVDDGTLAENEMMAMMIVLLIGGVSTVAAAAGSALLQLARNPDIGLRIRADPALASKHCEEAMRLDPPVGIVLRFARDNSEIDGTPIPAGMPVYVMIGTANHDPKQFPEPRKFSIDRTNSHTHMSFGYGIHTCIGNAITRGLVPLLVKKTVERFDDVVVVDHPDAIVYDSTTPRGRHLGRLLLELRP